MFPGNPKQFQDLQKKMQKMQADIVKQQEELEAKIWSASSGGGMVTVEMNGKYDIQSIKINPEVVDPDDVEMLEDLILAAIKDAFKKVSKEVEDDMSRLTGGIKIPGLF
ncbi:MAG: YbaB/EbfC family nucleoid-associated protein [Candidatus Cloacimonetes bacterium]|nr:YbaB/EbfC family nucleoid-associated protein [Candidatus Cloacimonadota bacterium]